MTEVFHLVDPPEGLAAEVAEILRRVRGVVPAAQVLEVGSTAVDGCIGKQDIDILVRVAEEEFSHTREALDGAFERDPQQLSNDRYQGYVVDSSFDVALQLTVAGCEYDRFEDFLQELRRDPDLVRQYNFVKRQWDGRSMSDYRQAKAAFIEAALGQRSERLEGGTRGGGDTSGRGL